MRGQFIVLTFRIKKAKDSWLARCEELGTSTYGDTFEEAQKNIKEAVLLHLDTLEDVGECERFLRENNVRVLAHRPSEVSVLHSRPSSHPDYAMPYIHPIRKALHIDP